jgi:hypothetical protein
MMTLKEAINAAVETLDQISVDFEDVDGRDGSPLTGHVRQMSTGEVIAWFDTLDRNGDREYEVIYRP